MSRKPFNRNKKPYEDAKAVALKILKHPVFTAAGELCALHFGRLLKLKGTRNFDRRPAIGLRIPYDGCKLLCRPAWTPGMVHYVKGRYDSQDLGTVDNSKVEVEMPVPFQYMLPTLMITQDGTDFGKPKLYLESIKNELPLKKCGRAFRSFLEDPIKIFEEHSLLDSRSRDHCCCCGKHLTDPLSRTRGIGPECWQYFDHMAEDSQDVVKKFRDLDSDWLSARSDVEAPDLLDQIPEEGQ